MDQMRLAALTGAGLGCAAAAIASAFAMINTAATVRETIANWPDG
jgi:hypothetical protein